MFKAVAFQRSAEYDNAIGYKTRNGDRPPSEPPFPDSPLLHFASSAERSRHIPPNSVTEMPALTREDHPRKLRACRVGTNEMHRERRVATAPIAAPRWWYWAA
jgi:hypothetical protein